jgi:hypothetical protein
MHKQVNSVVQLFSIVLFLFTADTVQKIKVEKILDQHVLKVEIKTEVEEDRDQLKNQVNFSSSSGNDQRPSSVIIDMY